MFQTPVLLITFNRPNHTRQVFEAIKKQKPTKLFVFQDGAREGNERDIENCKAVRAIFEEPLEWDCDLKTFYSEFNLGCGRGPSTGITWFFENVEQGIIFEDDCLPHPDFFEYCEILLKKYRDNSDISFISGTNFQDGIKRGIGSYYFSLGHHGTWGWATWKRTWQLFDYYLSNMTSNEVDKILRKNFKNYKQFEYFREIYKGVLDNRYNESCWDYQFYMTCWKNNMISVIPNVNLITNIGFDNLGTHTTGDHLFANNHVYNILPIKFVDKIERDENADLYLHKHYVQSSEYGWAGFKRLPHRINKRLKKLVGKKGSWL